MPSGVATASCSPLALSATWIMRPLPHRASRLKEPRLLRSMLTSPSGSGVPAPTAAIGVDVAVGGTGVGNGMNVGAGLARVQDVNSINESKNRQIGAFTGPPCTLYQNPAVFGTLEH